MTFVARGSVPLLAFLFLVGAVTGGCGNERKRRKRKAAPAAAAPVAAAEEPPAAPTPVWHRDAEPAKPAPAPAPSALPRPTPPPPPPPPRPVAARPRPAPAAAPAPRPSKPSSSCGATEGGGPRYTVHGVAAADVLNIREKPDPRSGVVGEIPPDATGVIGLPDQYRAGGSSWRKVKCGKLSGWVNERFLAREGG